GSSPAASSHKFWSPASRPRPPVARVSNSWPRRSGAGRPRTVVRSPLNADRRGELGAVHDLANMPLAKEPQQVQDGNRGTAMENFVVIGAGQIGQAIARRGESVACL